MEMDEVMAAADLIGVRAASDGLIALAYLSVPITFFLLVRRRTDLPFTGAFRLFGALVVTRAASHGMDAWGLFAPVTWVASGLKALTALLSVASAIVLARMLPRVLAVRDRLSETSAVNLQLKASEERFRRVLEEAPIGMVLVNDRGAITLVNRALEQTFGHRREELIGEPIEVLIPERFRGGHMKDRTGFFRAPHTRAVGAGRELFGLRKDGSEIPIEVGLTPLADGDGTHVLGSIIDLTERRRAEAGRRESVQALESFQLMVAGIKDYAIVQLDRDGTVTSWNSGAQAIQGYAGDEIIGRHLSAFYAPEASAAAAEHLRAAAASGSYEEEGWRVRKDGTRFWANVALTAIRSPDAEVRGFVKITRDLTELKRTEQTMAASLAERTALLQEVHHRVKNNLQMIVSLLNLQARQIHDGQARAIFLEARGRVLSIALLHESLYQSPDLGRVDMREYVSKLIKALRQTFDRSATSPRIVERVDAVHLPVDGAVPCGLIIHELVMNAMKHAFAGRTQPVPGEITIAVDRGPAAITLVVTDNGVGFASGIDPSADETMGLTLIRDLAAQLQGSATFTSANGAECRVSFPVPGPRSGLPAPSQGAA
jgi:PAS domain S-box-containing protein